MAPHPPVKSCIPKCANISVTCESGDYTYFSTSATCDLYDSPEDDPVLRGVSGSREIPTTYIDGVYCYTGETKEGDGEGDEE